LAKLLDSLRISLFISILAALLHCISATVAHLRESISNKEEFTYGYIGGTSFITAVVIFIAST